MECPKHLGILLEGWLKKLTATELGYPKNGVIIITPQYGKFDELFQYEARAFVDGEETQSVRFVVPTAMLKT